MFKRITLAAIIFVLPCCMLLLYGCKTEHTPPAHTESRETQTEDLTTNPTAISTTTPITIPAAIPTTIPTTIIKTTKPAGQAYSGQKTGNTALDGFVGRVLDGIITQGMTEREKMKAVYDWMPANIGWRGVVTNYSRHDANAFDSFVYPESEVVELAYYAYQNRKGSCEHYASLASVLLERLGYSTRVIYGLRKGYAYEGAPWGEHAWVEVTIEGKRYHFDPQYTRTHMKDRLDYYFLLPEGESREHHKW